MDNTNTPEPEARLGVDTTGSDFAVPSYIPDDPEDAARVQQLIDEVFANPLATPSPVSLTGGGQFKAPEKFTASILPPAQRDAVLQQLANVPAAIRAERESELVIEALKANSVAIRVNAGLGAGATEVQREAFNIEREVAELERQIDAAVTDLNTVLRFDPVFDEITGKPAIDPNTGLPMALPVHKLTGERRNGLEQHLRELNYRHSLLNGIEGQRRMERAAANTLAAEKAMARQLEERAEAKRLAEQMGREERIKAQAEAMNRMNRNAV